MNNKSLLEMCQYGSYDTDKFLESKIGFTRTRSQNRHGYVEHVYSNLFEKIRNKATQVLEIGVDFGGSILLFRDYFENATITGVDINRCEAIENRERVKSIVSDAYSKEFVNQLQDNFYDLIIDDGPHTLPSMMFFAEHYTPKLKDDGILIIEDIPSHDWLRYIASKFPENTHKYLRVYDGRKQYSRDDELLIFLDKGDMING